MRLPALVGFTFQEAVDNRGRFITLSLGVAVGVAALALMLSLLSGMGRMVAQRLLGVLPDRLAVESGSLDLGPLRLKGGVTRVLDDAAVSEMKRLPGVSGVYRQARLPLPGQIHASIRGTSFYSDVIIEGTDSGLVEPDLGRGMEFDLPSGAKPIPAVLPAATVDVLSSGLEIHTGGVGVGASALLGRSFALVAGSSSFRPGPGRVEEARVVGVSSQVGMAGPTIPLDLVREWWPKGPNSAPFSYYRVVLLVPERTALPGVVEAVHRMGYTTPGLERLARVEVVMAWLRLLMMIIGVIILAVAGLGIANGLGLMVSEETHELGLYRALGATRGDILLMVIARALAVGVLGSIGGLAGAAVLLLLGAMAASHWIPLLAGDGSGAFGLSLSACLWAAAFGVAAAVLSGWAPAVRAAHLEPAEALRDG